MYFVRPSKGPQMTASVAATTAVEIDEPEKWLGTTVDMTAVKRDAVLAGMFAGANAISGTMDPIWFVPGLLFGAFIGMVLHVLPAEPRPGDSRSGRITIRGICGLVGGAGSGLAFAYLASGYALGNAPMPRFTDTIDSLVVGAITGAAWYVVWGFWEMRDVEQV